MTKRIAATLAAVLMFSAPASAQSLVERGYAAAFTGITFQSETDALFGGEFGANVSPNLVIYGGGNFMRNVLPRNVQQELDQGSALLTLLTGETGQLTAKARAFTLTGGAKYVLPMGTGARPYLLGGGGLANVKVRVTAVGFGGLADALLQDGSIESESVTKATFEMGGGVEIPISALYFDFGYRYNRVVDEDGLNISRAHVGFGTRF